MRIRFQEIPWDLYACAVYTLLAALLLLEKGRGDLLALGLVVFVPGYGLVAALFPKDKEIGWLERIALSVGLSIVINPLLGFLLDFWRVVLGFASVVSVTLFFAMATILIAYWRRRACMPKERLSLDVGLNIPDWQEYTRVEKVLTVAVIFAIISAAFALLYLSITPRQSERFTEFYILGSGPNDLRRSEPSYAALGISNHEGVTVNYAIHVNLVGVQAVYNTTAGHNETLRLNVTALAWLNSTLPDGTSWEGNHSFSIAAAGNWELEFLLFRDGNLSLTYGEVHMFVRVS